MKSRQRLAWLVLLVVVSLGTVILGPDARALAQARPRDAVVVNPTVAEFLASADHAVLTSYVGGYFMSGATEPMLEVDLGKPTPDNAQTCTVALNVKPLAFATDYSLRIKAVAAGVASDWSNPAPFARKPLPVSGLVVR